MAHHLDRPIASDLSYELFQLRRLRGELGAGVLDRTNRRLHALPSAVVQREAFVVDRQDWTSEAPVIDERIPVWAFHGRRRKGQR